jgi:hypothetical protein
MTTNGPATFDVQDMEVVLQDEGVEVRRAPAGDGMTLLWLSCAKGFDFTPALRGLPYDMCCCEHWGFVTKGSMNVVTHDGQSLSVTQGQGFHLLPGHFPTFPEDCAFFEYTPTEHVERLFANVGVA